MFIFALKTPKGIMETQKASSHSWRKKLYIIIFEAETPAGKLFDVLLIWAILLSICVICLESMSELKRAYGQTLSIIEWFFTILFTIEFFLRIIAVKKPSTYLTSFYGVIDILAILPSYIGLFFVGAHSLMVIRAIRLLRIFRLFKLTRYVGEAEVLTKALFSGRHKIFVFVMAVFTLALFMGAVMFVVEGEQAGFTSIPKGMYWAIVTMTTVGYGDLIPQTDLGKTLASILMIMGYGIIAVPTGIVSVEIANATKNQTTRMCHACLLEGHATDAIFCRACAHRL